MYRFWRDAGFAAGVLADVYGLVAAVWAVAGLTAVSGLVVAVRMVETVPHHGDPAVSAEKSSDDALVARPRRPPDG